MNTDIVVALLAGAFSLVATSFTVWTSIRSNQNTKAITDLQIKEQKRAEAEKHHKEMNYYSAPLARSAYALKNRLHNILHQNLIDVYLVGGNEREQLYVIDSSVFEIAQYLCWTEIVRRDIQYIDTGTSKGARDFQLLQIGIARVFATDAISSPTLRLFAVEQQAVGEALRQLNAEGKWECMGYGAFLKTFPPGADSLIDALRNDVKSMRAGIAVAAERMTTIHDALKKLLDLLDPDAVSFPEYRTPKAKS